MLRELRSARVIPADLNDAHLSVISRGGFIFPNNLRYSKIYTNAGGYLKGYFQPLQFHDTGKRFSAAYPPRSGNLHNPPNDALIHCITLYLILHPHIRIMTQAVAGNFYECVFSLVPS